MSLPQKWSEMITQIHSMESKHHVVIGALLKKHSSVKLNETACGIMVNLSTVTESVLEEVQKYIDYVVTQESTLQTIEKETEQYKTMFY